MRVDVLADALAAVIGLCVGSFLNVCILRLPHDQSLLRPRSTCPRCRQPIAWYDNIPVVSWIVLGGRCRRCGNPISIQYPLIELLVGAIWMSAAVAWGATLHALAGALLGTVLLGIAVTDARHYLIPNEFTIGGFVIGLVLAFAGGTTAVVQALIGAAAGFVLLLAVAQGGAWLFKEEAMGGGDIKMMAMVGAFVGWRGVLVTVFAGALVGVLVFGPVSLKKKKLVPFGVFLALGAALAFVFGDAIVAWYRQFLGA